MKIQNTIRPRARRSGLAAATALTLGLGACDFGVTNPGPIEDAALNDARAMKPLVVGMGADLSTVMDDVAYFMGIASRDIWHSGAFEAEFFMQDGKIEPRHVNGLWSDLHRARWVAEQGIERMKTVLGADFEKNVLAPQAYLWAGFSNRALGENMCVAIIDGGKPEPHTLHFQRAEQQFSEAIRLAQAVNNAQLLNAGFMGRAQVRAALGKWTEAASDAARVPDDAVWLAVFSDNSSRERNWLVNQSHIRRYFTAYGTWATEVEGDPRVAWEDQFATRKIKGVDGLSPFVLQNKFTRLGDDIDLARGDEMRLIEAEALLRAGDVAGAVAKVNQVRAAAGVEPISASTPAEAWAALRREREIVLWMEGRRLWELRRFEDPFLAGRDKCIPISQNEANTNPNAGG